MSVNIQPNTQLYRQSTLQTANYLISQHSNIKMGHHRHGQDGTSHKGTTGEKSTASNKSAVSLASAASQQRSTSQKSVTSNASQKSSTSQKTAAHHKSLASQKSVDSLASAASRMSIASTTSQKTFASTASQKTVGSKADQKSAASSSTQKTGSATPQKCNCKFPVNLLSDDGKHTIAIRKVGGMEVAKIDNDYEETRPHVCPFEKNRNEWTEVIEPQEITYSHISPPRCRNCGCPWP